MNTKNYLQNAVAELERSMDWTSGVIFGLEQRADEYEFNSEEYAKAIDEIEKLKKVQQTSVYARMNLLEVIDTLNDYE